MPRTLDLASPVGPGAVLRLIRDEQANTRAQIMRTTGLSRATVAQRLETLLRAGYVTEVGTDESRGGRPAGIFQINRDGGVLLVAAVGALHVRTAVADLACGVLGTQFAHIDVGEGPQRVLGMVQEQFTALLNELGRRRHEVRGIGIGLPGPVEFAAGRVVSPPIMTGWDGFRVATAFESTYSCPVAVDNDVNCMALGEHRAAWPDQPHLVMVKAGTGVGSGLVISGQVNRGAQGSAGDVGHIPARNRQGEPVLAAEPPLCRCGKQGCVEAYAGGWALVRDLRKQGKDVTTARDVAALVRSGDVKAVRYVRTAGRILGQAIADVVSLLNPSVVAVGGALAAAEEHLLASIRQVVYESSTPLATRDLRIIRSRLGEDAGIVGTSYMVADELFAPHTVDRAVLSSP